MTSTANGNLHWHFFRFKRKKFKCRKSLFSWKCGFEMLHISSGAPVVTPGFFRCKCLDCVCSNFFLFFFLFLLYFVTYIVYMDGLCNLLSHFSHHHWTLMSTNNLSVRYLCWKWKSDWLIRLVIWTKRIMGIKYTLDFLALFRTHKLVGIGLRIYDCKI